MIKVFLTILFFSSFLFAKTDFTDLSTKLQEQNLTVSPDSLQKNSVLIELIVGTGSMDTKEKQYWLTSLPTLADEQIERLTSILQDEKKKLAKADAEYKQKSHELDIKQSCEWVEEIDKLLNTPNAAKPDSQFLLAGMEMISFYLENATADKALLDKMVHISDALLEDANLSDSNRAKTEYSAYHIHAMYPNFEHLSQEKEHLIRCIELSRKIDQESNDPQYHKQIGALLLSLSYLNLCSRDFKEAIQTSDEAITYNDAIKDFVNINKAHALIFLGKIDEAKPFYAKALSGESHEEIVKGMQSDIEDFKNLQFPNTAIKEIETILESANKK